MQRFETATPLNMPPEEVRIFNPKKHNFIETPLDYRGLVDLDELILEVKQTVEPDFTWQSQFNDVHHLQWYSSLYHEHHDPKIAVRFRELVNRKAYVPRMFHNWLHYVSLPPAIPSDEVMHYSIEAQRVAISLSKAAADAVKTTRRKLLAERVAQHRLERAFEAYNLYLDNAREVPVEFSLIKIEEFEVHSVEELLNINRTLGRMALDRIPLRDKLIQSPSAA